MAMSCLLCGSSVIPGNRAFLKQKGELVKSVLSCLNYQDNVEAEKFCENQVVCRGKCMGTLNRLVKLRGVNCSREGSHGKNRSSC